MRRSVKVLSVLMLLCVVMSLSACGGANLIGTWSQTLNQPGGTTNPNQLQLDFGELEFKKDGTYKRVGSTRYLGFGSNIYAESGTYDFNVQKSVLVLVPDLQNGVILDGTTKYTYMCYVDGNTMKIAMGDAGDVGSQVILERRG